MTKLQPPQPEIDKYNNQLFYLPEKGYGIPNHHAGWYHLKGDVIWGISDLLNDEAIDNGFILCYITEGVNGPFSTRNDALSNLLIYLT